MKGLSMKAPQLRTLDDILKFAVSKEEEAARTYADLAKTAKGGAGKMFQEFSKQEEGHKAKILKIEKSSLPAKPVKAIPDLKISDYLAEVAVGPESTYQDILVFAMKREEASTALYTDLAKVATTEATRSLFLLLAEEEKKHKLRIEKEYDENVLKEN
jgi:rubrerythrin